MVENMDLAATEMGCGVWDDDDEVVRVAERRWGRRSGGNYGTHRHDGGQSCRLILVPDGCWLVLVVRKRVVVLVKNNRHIC